MSKKSWCFLDRFKRSMITRSPSLNCSYCLRLYGRILGSRCNKLQGSIGINFSKISMVRIHMGRILTIIIISKDPTIHISNLITPISNSIIQISNSIILIRCNTIQISSSIIWIINGKINRINKIVRIIKIFNKISIIHISRITILININENQLYWSINFFIESNFQYTWWN